MKKLLLVTALGALSASQLFAQDLFITGSTAFRKQVYNACSKLYTGSPTIVYDLAGTIGGSTSTGAGNPVWTMTGTPIAALTAVSGSLTIHGNFTGSVQGSYAVENKQAIAFCKAGSGNNVYMTNTATIAFSDVSTKSLPYTAASPYAEQDVAVQPFVIVKSASTSASMNSITNATTEQLRTMLTDGFVPLTWWTGNTGDYSTPVYILNRTQDSGTRRTILACLNEGYGTGLTIYNYDQTNHQFYYPTVASPETTIATHGESAYEVIGGFQGVGNPPGNMLWGPGYVGGGDIAAALGVTDVQNLSLGYLSLADAQSIVSGTANNWSQVISYNGVWPTTAGPGIKGNTGANNFAPITSGAYPYWAYEVCVYPSAAGGLGSDQNLTIAELGAPTKLEAANGTILGLLCNSATGTPAAGSIDNEIYLAETTGSLQATVIRLTEMNSNRAAVGGLISY